VTTTGQRRSAALRPHTIGLWVLFLCDAGLLVASGLIHLHLWDIAYRHVKTLDVLFLVQVVACLLLAVVLLVTRRLLAVAAAWLLMAGTMVGIFGFKLTFSTGLANTVLIVEAAALIMLTITGMVKVRSSRSRA
jgi:hypothetical protein